MILWQRAASVRLAGFVSQVSISSHLVRHFIRRLVFSQTFPYFKREVQTRKIWIRIFEQLDHAQTLAVVIEPTVSAHTFGQHLFSRLVAVSIFAGPNAAMATGDGSEARLR